ncbi:MAG TPA: hypothetical protein VII56_13890 [Rhizomicrobium sp.]
MSDSPLPNLRIALNSHSVMVPALTAIKHSAEIITLCSEAIERADLTRPPPITAFMALELSTPVPGISADQRRFLYLAWLLGKGFHDLARGVRESLEAAAEYVVVAKYPQGQTTLQHFQAAVTEAKREANKMSFPALMEAVNKNLTSPLSFNREFLSLQNVRNCLEHRNGIVSEIDLKGDEALVLATPRFKIFYLRHGEEVELGPNCKVVPEEESQTEIQIFLKREIRERRYKLGERVQISTEEFHEIAAGCFQFVHDLASKLPVPTPMEPNAVS